METVNLAVEAARAALMTALTLSLPILAVALCVGLAIGVLQAITQVHDLAISYTPRILAVAITVLLLLPWLLEVLTGYTRSVLEAMSGGLFP